MFADKTQPTSIAQGALLSVMILLAFLGVTTPAFANMPFIFIFAWLPLLAVGMSIVGVLIEGLCVWLLLGLKWYWALTAVIVANLVSIIVGIVLIPLLGIPIELLLRSALEGAQPLLQTLIGFGVAQILLAAVNTAIELPVLLPFGVRWRWRSVWIILGANFVTVGLLIWPMVIGDIQIGKQPEEPEPEVTVLGTARDLGTDCTGCPEMVTIPAGRFTMGSLKTDEIRAMNQAPLHWVTIKPFAMGNYEVTWDEWELCVSEGGCTDKYAVSEIEWQICVAEGRCKGDAREMARSDGGWGKGRHPVINVSWSDARDYVRWLSKKSGKNYRLPSEAEWEYAARAGTTTRYSWGDQEPVCDPAAPNGAQTESCEGTRPVGSFRSNSFGLHDMHGNVSEWAKDCYYKNYRGAPDDGSARRNWLGGCGTIFRAKGPRDERVVRGFGPFSHRSASRSGHAPSVRFNHVGFRVARDL